MTTLLSANATADEIEEELVFIEVMISSLDQGADDYAARLAPLQAQKQILETRLNESGGGSRPQTSYQNNMSVTNGLGSHAQNTPPRNNTLNGEPGSNGNMLGGQPYRVDSPTNMSSLSVNNFMGTGPNGSAGNSMKRPRPYSMQQQPDLLYPSKRHTPDPSGTVTPASSTDSPPEWLDGTSNDLASRSYRRQMEAENVLRQRREAQLRDEELARSLSQPPSTSSFASSSRPGIQTTLNHNGSYHRPPPPTAPAPALAPAPAPATNSIAYPTLPMPGSWPSQIKQEPGVQRQQLQQLPQRPRVTDYVDLTNSDDEDDIAEVPRNSFTPNGRIGNTGHPAITSSFTPNVRTENGVGNVPRPSLPLPPMRPGIAPSMPAALPGISSIYQPVYGSAAGANLTQPAYNSAAGTKLTQPRYPWMQAQQTNPLLNGAMNAVNSIKSVARNIGSQYDELSNLINGRTHTRSPWNEEDSDDSDLVYGGSRVVDRRRDPFAGYTDMDLYHQRRQALEK